MKRLRILVCSLYAPYPPYDGGKMRTIELLKPIGEKHAVTYLGTFDPAGHSVDVLREHLLNYCSHVELVPDSAQRPAWSRRGQLRELFGYPPHRLIRFLTPEYIQTAHKLLVQSVDLVICNSILAGQLFYLHPAAVRKVLDILDILALSCKRELALVRPLGLTWLSKYVNWLKTDYYERRVWRCFDGLIAISETDGETVRRICPDKPMRVLPMGIHFPNENSPNQIDKQYDLLMVGSLDYSPNVDALEYFDDSILPLLLQTLPEIRVAIVGRNPTARVREITNRRCNYVMVSDPPDVAPYYRQSRVAIIPMRTGSGVKVKLLEALAFGVPVVTTPIGAFGLPVKDGEHVLFGANPQTFADQISNLLTNSELAQTMITNGIQLAAQNFDWVQIQQAYADFIEQISELPR